MKKELKLNKRVFDRLAIKVQREFVMGGLAETVYSEYAKEILRQYLEYLNKRK